MHSLANGDPITIKKRIVLHLGESGLGNRLLATVSAVVLAVIMDRVLVLDWGTNKGCAASYDDLFNPKKPSSHLYPLINPAKNNDKIEIVHFIGGG